jgi:CRISPR/Cas system endoribonuclease Cas6 (RAMP superfamily)
MKFGGLTGDISYTGELQAFMELLQLGEWLHIGGKTSFGLGKYELKHQGESA